MLYNVVINGKKIDEVNIPMTVSRTQLRNGLTNLVYRLLKVHEPYVKFEKLAKKDYYLVTGNKGKLLFTLEPKSKGFWNWMSGL